MLPIQLKEQYITGQWQCIQKYNWTMAVYLKYFKIYKPGSLQFV